MSPDPVSPWRRSTHCAESACLEVRWSGQEVAVRDSKSGDGPHLRYSVSEWAAFIAGVKAGEFDEFTSAPRHTDR